MCHCAGRVNKAQAMSRLNYPEDQADYEAYRVSKDTLRSGRVSISVGDILADNGRHICHRATSHGGLSGAPACMLANPSVFMGMHLGNMGELLALHGIPA